MTNLNSFLSPYEILPIQENKYLGKFSFSIMKLYVVYSLELPYCVVDQKDFTKLLPFASWPGATINPQLLKLPIPPINSYGPIDVRAIEVWL